MHMPPLSIHTAGRVYSHSEWWIALRWIGNWHGMNVRRTPAWTASSQAHACRVSRLVKTSVADVLCQLLWQHYSEVDSNVGSNSETGVNSLTLCWQILYRGMDLANAKFKSLAAIWHRQAEMRRYENVERIFAQVITTQSKEEHKQHFS